MPNAIDTNLLFTVSISDIKDLVICISLDKKISAINSVAEDFLGSNRIKLLNKPLAIALKSLQLDVMNSDNFKNLLPNLPINDLECSCTHHDGKNHYISWSILPSFNTNQTVDGIMIVGRDTTETKKLSSQVERLDSIIRYAPDWIYWKDVNSIHLGCNDQFAAAAGYKKRDEVIEKSDHDFPWYQQAEKFILDDRAVIESGIPKLDIEDVVPLGNNKQAIVISNKVPLRDTFTGQIIGVLGIATDITMRKQLEEELRLSKEQSENFSKAKTQFLLNISHDVKTPLSGIILMSKFLLKISEDPEIHKIATEIQESSHTLKLFFDNCMELSRLENSDVTLVIEPFDLKQMTEQVISLFKPALSAKNIELQLTMDAKIPAQLIGSRPTIYRILQNLLGNAVKFTHQGFIKVEVELMNAVLSGKPSIKIRVIDSGIGISKDKQHIIFKQFTRLVPSSDDVYEGSGIGLFLVQNFVNALQGKIEVTSEENKGCCFTVTLPIKLDH